MLLVELPTDSAIDAKTAPAPAEGSNASKRVSALYVVNRAA
jgi:hypothetical protein